MKLLTEELDSPIGPETSVTGRMVLYMKRLGAAVLRSLRGEQGPGVEQVALYSGQFHGEHRVFLVLTREDENDSLDMEPIAVMLRVEDMPHCKSHEGESPTVHRGFIDIKTGKVFETRGLRSGGPVGEA